MISLDGFLFLDNVLAIKSKFFSRLSSPKHILTNSTNLPAISSSNYSESKTGMILSSSGWNK